jgi:hypothetical protein
MASDLLKVVPLQVARLLRADIRVSSSTASRPQVVGTRTIKLKCVSWQRKSRWIGGQEWLLCFDLVDRISLSFCRPATRASLTELLELSNQIV